ncbi:ATP-dependent Clp protease proteolytic subunit [Lacticaseibacillus manihotivorans]|uniref:ATP-dependent Clp protease proteolytic subunit n=1 Tax=Lacticaseibacillus manihotivorans TaxID=88233 RepID=UPI000AD58E69
MIIPVKGYITSNDFAPIYRDWFGMTVVSPSDITDVLPDDGSDVTLEIASDGGEVDPATEVCNALRSYQGNVTAKIVSNAYSAATIVAMGANKVRWLQEQR